MGLIKLENFVLWLGSEALNSPSGTVGFNTQVIGLDFSA